MRVNGLCRVRLLDVTIDAHTRVCMTNVQQLDRLPGSVCRVCALTRSLGTVVKDVSDDQRQYVDAIVQWLQLVGQNSSMAQQLSVLLHGSRTRELTAYTTYCAARCPRRHDVCSIVCTFIVRAMSASVHNYRH